MVCGATWLIVRRTSLKPSASVDDMGEGSMENGSAGYFHPWIVDHLAYALDHRFDRVAADQAKVDYRLGLGGQNIFLVASLNIVVAWVVRIIESVNGDLANSRSSQGSVSHRLASKTLWSQESSGPTKLKNSLTATLTRLGNASFPPGRWPG